MVHNIAFTTYILYKYIVVVLIVIAASSITYVLTMTSFITGRLRNALGALVGIIFILFYVETELFEKKGILNVLTVVTFIWFVIVNTISNQRGADYLYTSLIGSSL